MICRSLTALVLAAVVLASARCSSVDLATALEITNVFSGWYDDGIKDGQNHLVPSITFTIHNKTPDAIRAVQLTVAFWRAGDDGEIDRKSVV